MADCYSLCDIFFMFLPHFHVVTKIQTIYLYVVFPQRVSSHVNRTDIRLQSALEQLRTFENVTHKT